MVKLFFVMFCRTTEVSKISKSILLNKDFLFKKNYNKWYEKVVYIRGIWLSLLR